MDFFCVFFLVFVDLVVFRFMLTFDEKQKHDADRSLVSLLMHIGY